MSEIRVNEVFMAGRIIQGPTLTEDHRVHFLLDASEDQAPFHCICEGKTAENLLRYCETGDEIDVEGTLVWMDFPNVEGRTLIISMRYSSYGRKNRTLRHGTGGR